MINQHKATSYILAQIKVKGFVEAKNITELCKLLNAQRTTIIRIIDNINLFNINNLKSERNLYHEFFVLKKYKLKSKETTEKVIIFWKGSKEFKEIMEIK